jgi:hypothetical protein
MAIHHFDVPALYLIDMSRIVADETARAAAEITAGAWRCLRPWRTSVALTASFLPGWKAGEAEARNTSAAAVRVMRSFGTTASLPRLQQLRRKVEHFDSGVDAVGYLWVQGRRLIREHALRRFSRRSPEERLGLVTGRN